MKTRGVVINPTVITLPYLVGMTVLRGWFGFSSDLILLLTFFFFYVMATTFNSVFCLTLQQNCFSMLLHRPRDQVHGLYNSLARCIMVYLTLVIGYFIHMDAIKNEISNTLSGSVKWDSPFGKAIWQCMSQAWEIFVALELVIPLLGISHQEIIQSTDSDSCN